MAGMMVRSWYWLDPGMNLRTCFRACCTDCLSGQGVTVLLCHCASMLAHGSFSREAIIAIRDSRSGIFGISFTLYGVFSYRWLQRFVGPLHAAPASGRLVTDYNRLQPGKGSGSGSSLPTSIAQMFDAVKSHDALYITSCSRCRPR